jgi:hypothetical protein
MRMGGRRGSLRLSPFRMAVALVVLIDVAVLGTDVFLLSNRSTTTQVDLQDALLTYRSAGNGTPSVTPATTDGAEATVPTTSASAPFGQPGTTAVTSPPATTSAAPASVGAPPTTAAPPLVAPPAEGVYEYRTSGGESISVLGAHHSYPDTTYAAVHRTGGCGWMIHADVIKEHVDERDMCTGADGVLQLVQSREVTFFGTTDGGVYTCRPPQVQVGDGTAPIVRTTSVCDDGKGSAAHLVRTSLTFDKATVGGVTVDVVRIRVDGTLSGRVRGTSVDLLTFVASSGLPVRWERSVDTLADAFGSTVRYQEQAQFDLVSLTPST